MPEAKFTKEFKRYLAQVTEEQASLKKLMVGSTCQLNIFDLRCSERTYDDTNRSPWLVARAEG
jgi:hypothetical protein